MQKMDFKCYSTDSDKQIHFQPYYQSHEKIMSVIITTLHVPR